MFHPRCLLSGTIGEKDAYLPLKQCSLRVSLRNSLAEIHVQMRFENTEAMDVNSPYFQFYFDQTATLTSFEASLPNTLLSSRIEKFPDDYLPHESLALENVDSTPQLFSVILGVFGTGEVLEVSLKYVTTLTFNEGELELIIPSFRNEESVPSIKKFMIDVVVSSDIEEVVSPSHQIEFVAEEGSTTSGEIYVKTDAEKPFSNFVLNIQLESQNPLALVQEDDETDSKMAVLTIQPPPELFLNKVTEYIFLVDRSGSMDNGRMDYVKIALPPVLKVLSVATTSYINVVGFGNTVEKCFEQSALLSEETRQAAIAYSQGIYGDLGKSLVSEALSTLLSQPPPEPGCARQVYIFTDGEIDEVLATAAVARQHCNDTITHVLSIGNLSRQHFASRVSRIGGGSAFTIPEENAAEFPARCIELVRDSIGPILTDLTVDWGSDIENSTPHVVPCVRSGHSLMLCGSVSEEAQEDSVITISTSTTGWSQEVTIPITSPVGGSSCHRYTAALFIQDLETGATSFPSENMVLTGSVDEMREEKVWEVCVWNNLPSSNVATVGIFQKEDEFDMGEDSPSLPVDIRMIDEVDEKEEPEPSSGGNSGSFWATFGFSSDTPLDKLLDSGEFTLEQLLDEDDVFSECQGSNETLLRYLMKPHVAKKVFDYASRRSVSKGEPLWNYTYLCTEILVLPMWEESLDVVYKVGGECIDRLPSVLAEETQDDQRIFRICRVLAFFTNVDFDRFVAFLKRTPSLVSNFLLHLTTSYVVDLLRNLLKPEYGNRRGDVLSSFYEANAIPTCLNLISDPFTSDIVKDNAADFLIACINASTDLPASLRPFEDEAAIRSLFDIMFQEDGQPSLSYLRGLRILTAVVSSSAISVNADAIAGLQQLPSSPSSDTSLSDSTPPTPSPPVVSSPPSTSSGGGLDLTIEIPENSLSTSHPATPVPGTIPARSFAPDSATESAESGDSGEDESEEDAEEEIDWSSSGAYSSASDTSSPQSESTPPQPVSPTPPSRSSSSKVSKPTPLILKMIVEHFPSITKVIGSEVRTRLGSFGPISISGETIISTVMFVESLTRVKTPVVDSALISFNILSLCIDALFRSPLNNFLHAAVEALLTSVLLLGNRNSELKLSLFKSVDLPARIVEGIRNSKRPTESGHVVGTHAYGGHLQRLALTLATIQDSQVNQLLMSNPTWATYMAGEFSEDQAKSRAYSFGGPVRF